jgi:uncharacterized lipoprotein YddW (UPF0748 family)
MGLKMKGPLVGVLFVLLVFGSLAGPVVALPARAAAPPFRGLWVPRWGLTDPAWVDRMVDDAARAGFTDLFVQVDGRGEAYYRSELLPPAEGLDGYDPLAAILKLGHARGLQIHAWINAFTVGLPGRTPPSALHPLNAHPDWVTHDAKGQSLLGWAPDRAQRNLVGYFLDPGLRPVQDFVAAVVAEVAERYPVDGIHLDYIRYPGTEFGYHPSVRAEFAERYGSDPLDLPAGLGRLAPPAGHHGGPPGGGGGPALPAGGEGLGGGLLRPR